MVVMLMMLRLTRLHHRHTPRHTRIVYIVGVQINTSTALIGHILGLHSLLFVSLKLCLHVAFGYVSHHVLLMHVQSFGSTLAAAWLAQPCTGASAIQRWDSRSSKQGA